MSTQSPPIHHVPSGPTVGEILETRKVPTMGHGRAWLCSIMPIGYSQTEKHAWLANPKAEDPAQMFSYQKVYAIPPAQGDYSAPEPVVYELHDVYCQDLDRARIQAENSGLAWTWREIRAHQMRDSLVDQWSSSIGVSQSGGRPGIFAIDGPDPSADEIKRGLHYQLIWTDFLIAKADQLWAEGKRAEIKNLYRRMAKWRGLTSTNDRPWIVEYGDTTRRCVACSSPVPGAMLKCANCGENLVAFALAVQYRPDDVRDTDAALAAQLERIAAQRDKETAPKKDTPVRPAKKDE